MDRSDCFSRTVLVFQDELVKLGRIFANLVQTIKTKCYIDYIFGPVPYGCCLSEKLKVCCLTNCESAGVAPGMSGLAWAGIVY